MKEESPPFRPGECQRLHEHSMRLVKIWNINMPQDWL